MKELLHVVKHYPTAGGVIMGVGVVSGLLLVKVLGIIAQRPPIQIP